ncbi:hypothetical protein BUALT_Bualt04G0117400 [Buddleja alternifolia]|uniref:RPW8 domain-containing protein n=1 Tax=Buddleja alternifolia TaxID=168488 RepID=A0AAV6XQB3_9LAMI|nr:hypothetical protein BUALT_Bualt04G0117400 [Buddleja alternifolia]
MGGVVEGAVLGAAFELSFKLILDAILKVVSFRTDLYRLKSTLSSIKCAVDDIQKIHRLCESEKLSFDHRLIEAEKLIKKCNEIKWINIFSRWYYSMKLNKLESLLLNSFLINAAAFHTRESKEISTILSNVADKIEEMMKNRESSSNRLPDDDVEIEVLEEA